MSIKGKARVDQLTKVLVKRLQPGEIAVIDHPELDDVAAQALLNARVKAVINASPSISHQYPNGGPSRLVSSGVTLIDNAGKDVMKTIQEGQVIEIAGDQVFANKRLIASGHPLTMDEIRRKMDENKSKMQGILCDFVSNTLEHAYREIGLINGQFKMPVLKTVLKGRQVLIVVRGKDYKEDLKAIDSYIKEMKPVLIGVDGGADALLESGYLPHLIIGDMDSVSDRALSCGAELIAHAYVDGRSPGLNRLQTLGLSCKPFAAPGTSEDIALLLAYEKGADLIVMVGAHTNIYDFLEKGRKGMASTFLVRLKAGSVLVDAKGVGKIYRSNIRARHLVQIVLAALVPAGLVAALSPSTRQVLRLIYLKIIYGM